jgi:tRNA dimethylallyltransferase
MKNAMVKRSYIVAGTTASGKSDFAHNLALRLGGTIINADSVQIYNGIENISASPLADRDKKQETRDKGHLVGGVSYKLFSIKGLDEQISVSDYLDLARAEYDAAAVPIFVGGSGYYINALVNGISPIPDVSLENRAKAREMVAENPANAREVAGCAFQDPQRISRALEVFLETGRPLSEWQKLPRTGGINPAPVKILIMPPVDVLAARIRERLAQMFERGIPEAEKFAGFPDRAIGIDEIGNFLRGAPKEQVLENWAVRTEQYAKRQRTWFRHQFDADIIIPRVPTEEDLNHVVGK